MKSKTTPLSFEIDAELAANLEKLRTLLGGVSFSKLIDHAIEQFDYKKVSRKTSGRGVAAQPSGGGCPNCHRYGCLTTFECSLFENQKARWDPTAPSKYVLLISYS